MPRAIKNPKRPGKTVRRTRKVLKPKSSRKAGIGKVYFAEMPSLQQNNTSPVAKNRLGRIFQAISHPVLVIGLIIAQALIFSAFEAHVINVTARICNYSQTKSMGYWKNHEIVYLPHLPQTLGNDNITNISEATAVFDEASGKEMKKMLKAQLLAMKFNIAHFGIGEYIVESEGKNLNDIVAAADELLKQDPEPPKEVLKAMKDLLESVNILHLLKFCPTLLPETASLFESGTADHLVINEVYYDPDGKHTSNESNEWKNEWIEIYNPNDEPISLTGWKIIDDSGKENIILTFPAIPPQGFAVLTPKEKTFDYWTFTGDIVRIVLGEKIGDSLENDSDRVILMNPDSIEIDAVSWGADTHAFNPSLTGVNEGSSLARILPGYDTDQASDWTELGTPDPGKYTIKSELLMGEIEPSPTPTPEPSPEPLFSQGFNLLFNQPPLLIQLPLLETVTPPIE